VLQRKLTLALTQGSEFVATQTFSMGQDAFGLTVSVVITLYLAFFLIRDGDRILHSIGRALPLADPHQRELAGKFGTAPRATVKGNGLVALVQGALGGLSFWFLDVSGALLWGGLMAALSLLPAVGAAPVWAPVALWLMVSGSPGAAVGLVAWGVLVIGLVDKLLRPLLVGKDTGLPDYLVMISTLGSMAVLGLNGFIIGPAVAAMFVAAWQIQTQAAQAADASG
jgi:predicted PurR-regulated permease PerM